MAERHSNAFLKLASAGTGIKVWHTSDYSLFRSFGLNFSPLFKSIHWSPDLYNLVSIPSQGDKLYLHLVKDDAVLHVDFPMKDVCTTARFSTTSPRFLGIGTKIGLVHLWDVKQKKSVKSFQINGEVACLHFNWNDSYVASGSTNGTISFHNINTCQSSLPLTSKGTEGIKCLQYSHLKKALLASSSDDGGIRLWDVNTNRLLWHFPSHFTPATSLRFSPISIYLLASVGLDKKINLFDIQAKKVIQEIECEFPITSLDFKDDGLTIAAGSTRGNIYVYDVRALKDPQFVVAAYKSSVKSLAFQNSTSRTHSKSRRSKEGSSHSEVAEFDMPYRPSMDIETSSASGTNSSMPMHTFVTGRQKQSLTSEIFSPLRDFSVRSSHRLSTPTRLNLLPESPVPDVKRKASKRSVAAKKYSLDIFSPVNESEYENLDENSKRFQDASSISYEDAAINIQKFDIDLLKEHEFSEEEEEDRKLQKSQSQTELGYNIEVPETVFTKRQLTRTKHIGIKEINASVINTVNNNGQTRRGESEMAFVCPNPTNFQAEYLRNIFMDVMEDYMDPIRKGINSLHVQMCRQYQELHDKLDALTIQTQEVKKEN